MISRFALSIVLTGISTFACAAVSPEEAQKLGNTLTLFGAIKSRKRRRHYSALPRRFADRSSGLRTRQSLDRSFPG